MKGIDCATPLTKESAKGLAEAGQKFAARYLVPERFTWKRLTKAEANIITEAGLKIISVFETSANRPAGGAAAGSVDGSEALKEAILIGQPLGSAIYFTVDFDAQPKHYDAIEKYLQAAGVAIPGYEVGVYASFAVIEEMARRGAAKHFWQTYAWSRGKKSAHTNVYQYKNGQKLAGVTLDLNDSYGNEGWWSTIKAVEPPKLPDLSEAEAVHVAVNGKKIGVGILVDGVTYVPGRPVVTPLGAQITFDSKTQTVNIND